MKPLFLTIFFQVLFLNSLLSSDIKPKQSTNGLYGYADEKGKFIIEPRFEKAFPFENGVARILEKKLWGLIDQKGNYKISPKYYELQGVKNNLLIVGINDSKSGLILYGLMDITGRELIKPQYQFVTPDYNNQILIVGKTLLDNNGKTKIRFGLINNKNNILIPITFKEIKHARFRTFATRNDNNLWNLFDVDGKTIFGKDYLSINDFDEISAVVENKEGWTIVSPDGKYLTDGNFRKIIKKNADVFELLSFPFIKVVDNKHSILFSTQYDELNFANENLYIFKKDEREGLLNEKGNVVLENKFNVIQNFKNGLSIVKSNNKYGVINQKLQQLLPTTYEKIEIDSLNGIIKALTNKTWVVFNRLGKPINNIKYEDVKVQPYAMMFVKQDKLWFLLNSDGKVVGPNWFNKVSDITNFHAVVNYKNGYGLIDTKGNWVIEPVFDSLKIISTHLVVAYSKGINNIINIFNKNIQFAVEKFELIHSNYLIITIGGKKGLINYRGKEIVQPGYDFISDFSKDSIITILKDKKYGLIDLKGNFILKTIATCDEMGIMQEERVPIKIKNKYGFFDKEGGLRIANRYESVLPFSNGLAAFLLKGKWGFINKAEEIIIQPQYDKIENFKNEIAIVQKNNKWGILNKNGLEILKPQFDNIYPLPNGKYISESAGKKGLIGSNGKEIIPIGYDILQQLNSCDFLAKKNGKYGLLTSNGMVAIPLMYDKMKANGKYFIISIEDPPKRIELK